jgi:hypothetical protein
MPRPVKKNAANKKCKGIYDSAVPHSALRFYIWKTTPRMRNCRKSCRRAIVTPCVLCSKPLSPGPSEQPVLLQVAGDRKDVQQDRHE